MEVMNCVDNSVIKRHLGSLPRGEVGEAGALEEGTYKRDSEGVCWTRVREERRKRRDTKRK